MPGSLGFVKNNFNLVAAKRPPPMNIGYNEEGKNLF